MTTTMDRPRPGASDTHAPLPGRSRPKVRGRGWPVALIGVAAVVLCAVAAWMWAARNDQDRTVLVAATAMSAGHTLSDADLTEATVASTNLDLIDADQISQVVGQTLAVPVTAGTALTPSLLGSAASLEAGRAETTLAFADGFFPIGLEPGQAVIVMAGPGGEATPTGVWQMTAIVRTVSAVDGGALVGLEFDAANRDGLSTARATELFLVSVPADALAQTEEGE
jgi:hypothetical protein